MTTQPDATQNGAPVRRSIWKFFCDVDEAKGMLALVRQIAPDAAMFDMNQTFFGGSLVYTNPRVEAFGIQGTFKIGDETMQINESAGWLLDRQATPNPFVDRNADGSLGGPTLKYTDIGGGYVELYWGK